MKWPMFLLPALLSGIALSGCSCDEPIAEGEGEGEGEGELLPDAIELCTIYTRGQSQFIGSLFGGGFARCSATDTPPEFSAEQIAAIREGCSDPTNPTAQEFQKALTGGRVTMNVANIQACAAFVPEGQAEPPAACDDLFEPLVGAGGDCEQGWDCEGDLLCEAVDITVQALTCTPPAALGEPCLPQVNFIEAPARTCDAGLECVDFVCVAAGPAGPDPQVDDPCSDTSECGDELRCDFGAAEGEGEGETQGTCQPRRQVGEACESADDCALLPDADGNPTTTCGLNGTCVVMKLDGEACDLTVDVCAAPCSVCRASIPRAAATTCQDRGAAGEACRETGDCRHNLVCDAGTNTCVIGGGAGAACESVEDCRDDTLDCGGAGTCVVRPGIGGACGADTTSACLEGTCVEGQCRAGDAGDPCTTDDECSGLNLCVGEVCAPAPTSGPCSIDDGCADGFTCDDAFTCQPTPGLGDDCTELDCDAGLFCNDSGICETLGEAGAQCSADVACRSGACVNGTCGAVAAGCTSDKGFFQTFVILALVLPIRLRRRRH